jgi:hypothetical protein
MTKFQTGKIKMIQAVCLDYSIHNSIIEEIKGFSYEYKTETSADEENKYVFVHLKIDIQADLKEKKTTAGSFEFGFTFEVENLNELITEIEGKQSLDDTLHFSVMGIAFSTARGIIITRGAGTILNDAYLPVVNPATLLNSPF